MTDREIFMNAPADASPEVLEAYLDKLCGDDAELRARVEALLAADEEAGTEFMGEGAVEEQRRALEMGLGAVSTLADDAPVAEGEGDTIGNYKLLQKIGEGGFGLVYMADQLRPVKRRVALKIIKLGMDTRQVVARFEAERQALALMDHPNIAKVHDAGSTETGRPYFVMELVKGVPITTFCDEQSLSTEERLKLFMDVCHAVQHAHQKGIIHRDLKPSNVMVTLHDDKAVVKVIDFGVAKATQMELTEKTLFTRFEQFIGTPAYMSPEQAQLSGLDIDTRSDIYSLGVLLYELLTGRTPFDAKELLEAGYDEIRRVIREDEPPKPSTRLSTMGEAEITDLAKHRSSAPAKLRALVRGELDWIVMKALEKDRKRRYETASGFARDLRSYLADEPVTAVAPSASYRIGKFVRRHRSAVVVAATMALLLLAGIVTSTWFAMREKVQREIAEESAQLAKQNEKKANQNEQRAKTALQRARILEGEAWLGLARHRADAPGPNPGLYAALNAGRAIGFEGYGRESQGKTFAESYPVLLGTPGATNYQSAQRIIVNSRDAPRPIWRTPASRHHGNHDHNGRVGAVAFTRDGRKMASGSIDRSIKVWDFESGELRLVLTGHRDEVTSLVFGPEGDVLYSASADGSVRIWDVETGVEQSALTGHRGRVTTLALNRGGTLLASGSEDETIKIWDLKAESARTLTGHSGGVQSVDFSPDGMLLASGGKDRRVRIWEVASGHQREVLEDLKETVQCVAFSPDGSVLAGGGTRIVLWDAVTHQVEDEFAGPTNRPIGGMAFGPNGETLTVTSSWDVHRRDLAEKTWVELPGGHWDGALAIASGPDGSLASGGMDCAVSLWDPEGVAKRTFAQLTAHRTRVHRLAISPDGRFLATGGQDYRVKLWNLATGEGTTLGYHGNRVFGVAFSPDGTLLATSAFEKSDVRLWDVKTGQQLEVLPVRGMQLAFSPDGETLAVGGYAADRITLWDVKERTRRGVLPGHRETIVTLAFSPDGRTLASGSYDHTLKLWDVESRRELQTLTGSTRWVLDVEFSLDGRTIAAAGGDRSLRLYEIDENRQATLKHTLDGIRFQAVAFSPDGRTLAGGGWSDHVIRLWNTERLDDPPREVTGHASLITDLAFAPDGRTLASSSFDHSAVLLDLGDAAPPLTLQGHEGFVEDLAFSADGKTLVSGGYDNRILQWDLESGTVVKSIESGQDRIWNLAMSPDGRSLAAGSRDNRVVLWDLENGGGPTPLEGHEHDSWCAAYSPDGETLATGSRTHSVILWDVARKSVKETLTGHTDWVRCVVFSPDGSTLASAGDDHSIIIWDWESGRAARILRGHSDWVHGLAFSHDGKRLASASYDRTARIWDLENEGALLHSLRAGPCRSIAFSPNSRVLAVGNFDIVTGGQGLIKLWDTGTGQLLRTLPGHPADVERVLFSPDGRTLASAGRDGTVRLWPIRSGELNLAAYLGKGWVQMDAQKISWPATSDNLYSERKFDFLNVSSDSTAGILRSGSPDDQITRELFWSVFRARNWPHALSIYAQLEGDEVRQRARAAFGRWLWADWDSGLLTRSLAAFRLRQLQDLPAAARDSVDKEFLAALADEIKGSEPRNPHLADPTNRLPQLAGLWFTAYGNRARIEQEGRELRIKVLRGTNLIHQWTTAAGTIDGKELELTTFRGQEAIRKERAQIRVTGESVELLHIDGEEWQLMRPE